MRAYFIRRGDHTEPVRYEVDRIRNGRSFVTRRVVARQAIGAILNLEASYQRAEESAAVHPVDMPDVPAADELEESSWSTDFDRRFVPEAATPPSPIGAGRTVAWMRVTDAARRRRPAAPMLAGLPLRRPALPTRSCGRTRTARRSTASERPVHRQPRPQRLVPPPAARPTSGTSTTSRAMAFAGGRGLRSATSSPPTAPTSATFAQEALVRDPSLRG